MNFIGVNQPFDIHHVEIVAPNFYRNVNDKKSSYWKCPFGSYIIQTLNRFPYASAVKPGWEFESWEAIR